MSKVPKRGLGHKTTGWRVIGEEENRDFSSRSLLRIEKGMSARPLQM
jgi:hypothetical protein